MYKFIFIAIFSAFVASASYAGGQNSVKVIAQDSVQNSKHYDFHQHMIPATIENSKGWKDDEWFQFKYNDKRVKNPYSKIWRKENFNAAMHGYEYIWPEDIT